MNRSPLVDEKLKQVPKAPGVYFFKDINQKIIYIGKAKILKNRVRSYFSGTKNKDAKTVSLVQNIANIDWMVVRDEVEALLTETNLIKEHRPRYNIFMKDDKTFPYIQFTNEPYPQVLIIRSKKLIKDGHKYYGPFTDTRYLRETLRAIHKIFPLRTCNYFIDDNVIKKGSVKLCLDYHINRCEGPCEGLVTEEKYRNMINGIEQFIKGRNDDVRSYLENKMSHASEKKQFEEAARYRDQLQAVEHFTHRQKKISQDFIDKDVLVISSENNYGVGVLMRVRNGLFIGREKFNMQVLDSVDVADNLKHFVIQYYTSTDDIPPVILVEIGFSEKVKLESWLSERRGSRVKIMVPQRGEKVKLVQICRRNADLLLGDIRLKKMKRRDVVSKKLLQLQTDLNMSAAPRRIEAFDNSNIQGSHPVASMVCFVDGKPKKKEYRKFSIKTVDGIDDFGSMTEIVTRRYSRLVKEKKQLPDLVLVDGGKGQLSAGKKALDNLGLSYIPIIGLAKKLEDVFIPGHSEPQNIPKSSPGLFLLREIRDEAHRFAITFHRQKRSKAMVKSELEEIRGMGKERVKKLWSHYKTKEEILKADVDEIYAATKIPKEIIRKIKVKLDAGIASVLK
ncbi:MAG: excinuclease ABC subunit C [Candidatus Marinimicrobia bacterium]|jgi:excinuclease ABC subunit C|nr:excinuclease ABC subunit C [Candidatus Neomarinimicrobiota bacterium]MBT3634367.1 excinuclease ABC subunit C [Candidatus Neomarinimicrobiota bacterium]MBT3681724.1 excinuclease ABC subunit C [Candidatus Neomarinimicrobiota bacterium]MBT3759450.1 excinuclease ABC subunit C [Candidatus Neomarinimicrobiota bacterium]MBT3895938.1 excinuclease ABC subunit C [Candidatus Neomarinimicrobiota bacterium]